MSTNPINLAKPFSWRGITAPCSEINTSFSHRQAERKYPFIDVSGHSHTGRESMKVALKVHFINTIEDGLYPAKWQTFRKFLLDGSPGKFSHPDLGKFDAVVNEGDYAISPESSAGITVSCTFTETRLDLDSNADFKTPQSDAKAAASQCDNSMAALGIDYPDGTNVLSFTESLAALATTIQLLPLMVEGKINAIEGAIENVLDRFDAAGQAWEGSSDALRDANLGDPARATLFLALHILFDGLEAIRDQVKAQARPTATLALTADKSFSAIADQVNNDLGDLILLNPTFGTVPVVPSGSTVLYFTG